MSTSSSARSGDRVLVLGATGDCGITFIAEALSRSPPLRITAYARSPDKIPEGLRSRIKIVKGDLDDREKLQEALEDASVVVSFLGVNPSLKAALVHDTHSPIAEAFPTMIEAMRAQGVTRLLSLSTFSYTLPDENWSWFQWLVQLFLRITIPKSRTEIRKLGKMINDAQDLEWTLFRVPVMTNDPTKGRKVGSEARLDEGGHAIGFLSRQSLCEWIIDEITDKRWIRKAPLLSNP